MTKTTWMYPDDWFLYDEMLRASLRCVCVSRCRWWRLCIRPAVRGCWRSTWCRAMENSPAWTRTSRQSPPRSVSLNRTPRANICLICFICSIDICFSDICICYTEKKVLEVYLFIKKTLFVHLWNICISNWLIILVYYKKIIYL